MTKRACHSTTISLIFLGLLSLSVRIPATPSVSEPLPIWETEEEKLLRHLIGEGHRVTPPPPGPVRCPAEFEDREGVLFRWQPYQWDNLYCQLVNEVQEVCKVHLIVEDSGEQIYIENYLISSGVPLDSIRFLYFPINSIWMRDYGPWWVFDSSNSLGIVDLIYNRPRPQDDSIPIRLGQEWGIPVYGPDLVHAGGNFMVDGCGLGLSTTLILEENPGYTPQEIDSIMEAYLGCEDFHTLQRLPSSIEYTGHIDMFAKLLDCDKVLVGQYPAGHPGYNALENNTIYLAALQNGLGQPLRVVRIPMPTGTSACRSYTNSLFVEDKILVPTYNISLDDSALSIYRRELPGYEVLGFDCSGIINWGGAIHCITMGVVDQYLLLIQHVPLADTQPPDQPYPVVARIIAGYGSQLNPDSLLVYWDTDSLPPFNPILMAPSTGPDSFQADIPQQASGTTVYYYIFASDSAGNSAFHPRLAPAALHSFYVGETGVAEYARPGASPLSCSLSQNFPNPFSHTTTIRYSVQRSRALNRMVQGRGAEEQGRDLSTYERINLSIYDLSGRLVKTLVDGGQSVTGYQSPVAVRWDGRDEWGRHVPAGVYFYTLSAAKYDGSVYGGEAGQFESVKKMVVLK